MTISKIRFLESRGLIHPERTPSGYRKFYATDVERLRWILRQQRELYLPLNVIKVRLDGGTTSDAREAEIPSLFDTKVDAVRVEMSRGSDGAHGNARHATEVHGASEALATNAADGDVAPFLDVNADLEVTDDEVEEPSPLTVDLPKGSVSTAGLAAKADVDVVFVDECEEYGLIAGTDIQGIRCYGEDAVVICRLAGKFRQFGIEPRHLKMFQHAAAREASLFAQAVTPLLRQRNPEARERALADLAQLRKLAIALKGAFVQTELNDITGG